MNKVLFWCSIVLLTSCQGMKQLSYYTDDLYYNDDITHNFNTNAILNNESVAMPDSAVVYFDENEAKQYTPSYSDRIAAFKDEPSTNTGNSGINPNVGRGASADFFNNVSVGVGVGVGVGSYLVPMSPYNPYYHSQFYNNGINGCYGCGYYQNPYSGYNHPYAVSSTYYAPPVSRPLTPKVTPERPYNPNISTSRYEADRARQAIRPATVRPNANPGYNSNSSRSYRSGTTSAPRGVWSNPGYHQNNSRTNSGSPSGGSSGTVRGVRRR